MEEMGQMEDEMRRAEDLIKMRKEHAERKALGSKRYVTMGQSFQGFFGPEFQIFSDVQKLSIYYTEP